MMLDDQRFNNLMSNSACMFILQLANFIVPFYVYNTISNIIGLEYLGQYFYFIAYVYFIVTVCDFGLTITSLSKFSRVKFKSHYLSSVFCIKVALFLLSLLSLPLFWFVAEFSKISILFVVLSIFFQSLNPVWYFQSKERNGIIVVSGVVGRLLNFFVIFLFYEEIKTIEFFLFAYTLGVIIPFVVNLFFLEIDAKWPLRVDLRYIKSIMRLSLKTFKSRMALTAYTSFNTFLIGALLGMQYVSIYGMAEKIYQAGQGVVTPVSQVLFPFISNKPDSKLFIKTVFIFMLIFIVGCLIIMTNTRFILEFLFNEIDDKAITLTRIYLFVSIINAFSVFMGFPAFALFRDLITPNATVLYGACIYALLLPFSILFFGYDLNIFVMIILIVEVSVLLMRVRKFNNMRKMAIENNVFF